MTDRKISELPLAQSVNDTDEVAVNQNGVSFRVRRSLYVKAAIASGTITPRTGAIDFSGGADGDVLTVQADGSLAPETPSGGGSGHTVQDEGTPLAQRTSLNFVGTGVLATDDAGNDATVVTIQSGGDMLAATYDPNVVQADAFDMANMVEAADAKVLTSAERSLIASATQPADIASFIEAGDVTFENLDANGDVGTGATQVAAGDHTHDATSVSFTPAGDIVATNVQAAIAELDSEKAATADLGNATALRSVDLDATVGTPSDGDILVYRNAGTDWVLEAKPAGGAASTAADIDHTQAWTGAVQRTVAEHLSETVSILDFGAKGDLIKHVDGGAIDTGVSATTLSRTGASFTAADVGKYIHVAGAGPDTGNGAITHVTTIASINSTTSVELTDAASTTVTDAEVVYATDDTTAIQAAWDYIKTVGGTLVIPHATYLIRSLLFGTLADPVTVLGIGHPTLYKRAAIEAEVDHTFAFERMIRVQPITGAVANFGYFPLVTFDGVRLDGNRQNQVQSDGAGGFEPWGIDFSLQHHHGIIIEAPDTSANRQPVRVQNCDFLNTTGEGIDVYTNVRLEVENCRFYACFRGGITTVGHYNEIIARNCQSDDPLDSTQGMWSGFYMEAEPQGWGLDPGETLDRPIQRVHIDGWIFYQGTINIGTRGNASNEVELGQYRVDYNLRGLVVPRSNQTIQVHFQNNTNDICTVSDSVFYSPKRSSSGDGAYTRTRVAGRGWRFRNCQFIAADVTINKTSLGTPTHYSGVVLWQDGSFNHPHHEVVFEDCLFSIDSSVVDAADGLPVYAVEAFHTHDDREDMILANGFLPAGKVFRNCTFGYLKYPRSQDLALEPVIKKFDYLVWQTSPGILLRMEGCQGHAVNGLDVDASSADGTSVFLTLYDNEFFVENLLYNFVVNADPPEMQFVLRMRERIEAPYNSLSLPSPVSRIDYRGSRTIEMDADPTASSPVSISGAMAWSAARSSNTYEGRLNWPVVAGTVSFTNQTKALTVSDDGAGNLTGDVAAGSEADINTIDYATGWFRFRWSTAAVSSDNIVHSYDYTNTHGGLVGDIAVLKSDPTQRWVCTASHATAATWALDTVDTAHLETQAVLTRLGSSVDISLATGAQNLDASVLWNSVIGTASAGFTLSLPDGDEDGELTGVIVQPSATLAGNVVAVEAAQGVLVSSIEVGRYYLWRWNDTSGAWQSWGRGLVEDLPAAVGHTHTLANITDAGPNAPVPSTPGTFNPAAIDLSVTGHYKPYAQSGAINLTLSGATHVIGAYASVRITGDGSNITPTGDVVWADNNGQEARTISGTKMLRIEYEGDYAGSGTPKAVAAIAAAGSGGGISNVVEDTTPQLGGDLDLNGFNLDFPTTPNIADVLDEDDMASDSATALATQQSIKAYTDTKTGGGQIVNVLDHGAVGDDTTTVTTEINAAIAAVNALSGPATLWFPVQAGAYEIDGALTTVRTGVSVWMDGKVDVNITPAIDLVVWQIGSETAASNGVSHRLMLDARTGGDARYTTAGFTGVYLPNHTASRIWLHTIKNFTVGAEIYGVSQGAFRNTIIVGDCFQNTKTIWCGGKGTSGWFNLNRFTGAGEVMGNAIPTTELRIGIDFENRDTGFSGNGNLIDGNIGFASGSAGTGERIGIRMNKESALDLISGRFEDLDYVADITGNGSGRSAFIMPTQIASVTNGVRVAGGAQPPVYLPFGLTDGELDFGGRTLLVGQLSDIDGNQILKTGGANEQVAVGRNASAGTATDATVVGDGAGNAGMTGVSNTIVGTVAGASLTSSINNVLIGHFVGNALSSGSGRNVAIGTNSLLAGTSCERNFALGHNALKSVTTGSFNIGIGVNAFQNTTGQNNLGLGNNVADNATSGNQNIVIGADVDLPVDATNGQIAIANLFFGTGATGTGTTVPAGAKAGIGVNNPTSRLQVDGAVRPATFTVASVPSASTEGAGAMIHVSNGAAGSPVQAFSDGTNWLRCDTLAAISAT